MRVATYNVRNGRAPDLSSFWWTRRRALAEAIAEVDADLWGLQEVYRFQRRYLRRVALPDSEWGIAGVGRNAGGGGEQVPVLHKRSMLTPLGDTTLWFGPTPHVAGSVVAGASGPRIAVELRLQTVDGGRPLRVLNLHLDSDSGQRRADSVRQLASWVATDDVTPTIVMGDFNGAVTAAGFEPLAEIGLRSALDDGSGPTSNGFGRRLDRQGQIDHVFVSAELAVRDARIAVDAGHASDHYPVVVDLELLD